MSMKNPLTPAGIEPATFRFVAQHLIIIRLMAGMNKRDAWRELFKKCNILPFV